MPPKRRAPSDGDAGKAKKAKAAPLADATAAATATTTPIAAAPKKKAAPKETAKPPRPDDSRWAKMSASGNVEDGFEELLEDAAKAYAFECSCPPIFEQPSPSADEKEDEDEDEEEEGEDEDEEWDKEKAAGQAKCDDGKTCMCRKKPEDHPDHAWSMTEAGRHKYLSQYILATLRNPDNFNMYTYNEHFGYGLIEMLQNLLVDFAEAEGDWRKQWSIVEATGYWLLDEECDAIGLVNSGDATSDAYSMVGRMLLTMVARLDREGVMGDVPNLGTMMAVWLRLAHESRENGLLEEGEEKVPGAFNYDTGHFDDYVLAYARKHNITLRGPKGLEGFIAECDDKVKLPKSTHNKNDPWGYGNAFKLLSKQHAGVSPDRGGRSILGGDHYDITTWTSVQRKSAAFDNRDPLGRREKEAIKKGMIMRLG